MLRRAVPFLLLCTVPTACGGGEDPEVEVRTVVERFGTASAAKDFQAICDELLAPALVRNVEQYGLPCELAFRRGIGDVAAPKLVVLTVAVDGGKASARVRSTAAGQKPSTDTLRLRRSPDDEWRIEALG